VAAGGAKKLGLSTEEIAKVKEEWEERQRKKKESEKESEKGKEKDEESKEKDEKKNEKAKSAASKASASPVSQPSTPTPTHLRYSLHRDIFAMRLGEHRKRRQTAQAKELAPRLPGAPRGGLPSA